jgi:hypothetical protein
MGSGWPGGDSLFGGDVSDSILLRTSATTFGPSTVTVSSTGTAYVPSFAPIPEPSTALAGVITLAAAGGADDGSRAPALPSQTHPIDLPGMAKKGSKRGSLTSAQRSEAERQGRPPRDKPAPPARGKPWALLDTRVIYCGLQRARSGRRCVQLARVLEETGSFYYHCDRHASAAPAVSHLRRRQPLPDGVLRQLGHAVQVELLHNVSPVRLYRLHADVQVCGGLLGGFALG